MEGLGTIYCLAGIGAHIPGMVESTRSADRVLVIDGCSVACGKKTVMDTNRWVVGSRPASNRR